MMKQYREIINDWKAFKEACEEKKVTTVRRNNIKAEKNFQERLENRFIQVSQADWNSNIFRLENEKTPGKSTMHWLGEYYVQEESAAIPVRILNPKKDEDILDMCAAPGGKSTQIASIIQNNGNVIANDKSSQRLKSLHANVYRTGSASISVTNYDGRRIPENHKFEKILLDAPCSGEGDRARRKFMAADQKEKKTLSKLQIELGKKASSLLKKGGTLVYSTCTINPTENEKVVKKIIEKTSLSLEKIELNLRHDRGVKKHNENYFGNKMNKTVRIYPNHLNSGVIFIAKFRK